MRIPATVYEIVDGALVIFKGAPRDMTHHMSTKATVEREDGSREEIQVEPYPVKMRIDPRQVQAAVAQGVWTQEDLSPYGLVMSDEFNQELEEGMMFDMSNMRTLLTQEGKVVIEVPVIPEPPPPTPLTVEQKFGKLLDDYGLSREDVKAMVAATEPTSIEAVEVKQ